MMALAFGYPQASEATLYKWKDDKGKTHFTDDSGKIPLQYRKKSKTKIQKDLPQASTPSPVKEEVSKSVDESEGDKEAVIDKNKELAEDQPEEKSPEEIIAELEGKKKKLEEELTAIVSAVGFFDVEVPRYDEYYERFPGRGVYRNLRALMSKVVEEKKALGIKLKDIDAEVGQAALAYINDSLPRDQKFATSRGGHMKKFKTTVARLKKELPTKKSLLGKLKKEQSDLEEELKALTVELEEISEKIKLAESK